MPHFNKSDQEPLEAISKNWHKCSLGIPQNCLIASIIPSFACFPEWLHKKRRKENMRGEKKQGNA